LTIVNSTATGSSATAGTGGTGLAGHNGSAGTANAISLFNYAGTVNSSSTTGPSTLLDEQTQTTPAPSSAILLLFGLASVAICRLCGARRVRPSSVPPTQL